MTGRKQAVEEVESEVKIMKTVHIVFMQEIFKSVS